MKGIQALVVVFLLSSLSGQANTLDVSQVDSANILPLKNATLEQSESKSVRRYLLPLGAMIKINGQWRSKKHDILSGELTRTTYLLKDDESFDGLRNLDGIISLREVYQYYLSQLKQNAAQVLFQCQGRDCGSSNQWGNGFVGNKRLVGRDRDQAYLAASEVTGQATRYFAIYIVKNATAQTRVHIDSLSIPSSRITSNNASQKSLEGGRLLTIPVSELASMTLEKQLAAMVKLLKNQQGSYYLYLVGHAYGNAPVAALREKSKGYASQLKEIFKKLDGMDETVMSKIVVEGVGPLAPVDREQAGNQLDRVELILH